MNDYGLSKNRRRFRFRVSLRAWFALMLVIGAIIGWYSSQTRRAMIQHEAVQRIRELGGHATFAYQLAANGRKIAAPSPPAILRPWTGDIVMSDVVKVSWHAPLAGAQDTQPLSALRRLQDLRLNMRRITDDGIRPVASLTQLRRLDLWCAQLTDRALSHVAGLHELRVLDLSSTQVTDQGLEQLNGLEKLEVLKVRNTQVTLQGASRLKAALPNCKILGVGR